MSPKDSTAMTETEILARLRTFLQETFLYMKPDFVLSDDDSLLQTGIVDSMGVMEVLGFIDEDKGKSRKCTSEQCGHIYLIVIINPPFVSSFD